MKASLAAIASGSSSSSSRGGSSRSSRRRRHRHDDDDEGDEYVVVVADKRAVPLAVQRAEGSLALFAPGRNPAAASAKDQDRVPGTLATVDDGRLMESRSFWETRAAYLAAQRAVVYGDPLLDPADAIVQPWYEAHHWRRLRYIVHASGAQVEEDATWPRFFHRCWLPEADDARAYRRADDDRVIRMPLMAAGEGERMLSGHASTTALLDICVPGARDVYYQDRVRLATRLQRACWGHAPDVPRVHTPHVERLVAILRGALCTAIDPLHRREVEAYLWTGIGAKYSALPLHYLLAHDSRLQADPTKRRAVLHALAFQLVYTCYALDKSDPDLVRQLLGTRLGIAGLHVVDFGAQGMPSTAYTDAHWAYRGDDGALFLLAHEADHHNLMLRIQVREPVPSVDDVPPPANDTGGTGFYNILDWILRAMGEDKEDTEVEAFRRRLHALAALHGEETPVAHVLLRDPFFADAFLRRDADADAQAEADNGRIVLVASPPDAEDRLNIVPE